MSPQRQQIVIATSRGFRECWVCPCGCGDARGKYGEDIHWKPLPDYLNSRDAMAEALAGLTEDEWEEFADLLLFPNVSEVHSNYTSCRVGCTATPSQLREAYLRTKGLWEE